MAKVYATLMRDDVGDFEPDGFVGEVSDYGSAHGVADADLGVFHSEDCLGCQEDRETQLRLTMALALLDTLGYSVAFGSEPLSSTDYEELSK